VGRAVRAAWRSDDANALGVPFTDDGRYLRSPYAARLDGLEAIRGFWSDPTPFTMTAEPVAVARPDAVVRVEVQDGVPAPQEYRDLWVLRFAPDGRLRH
jgi:ketosteroid isomerase-like protein